MNESEPQSFTNDDSIDTMQKDIEMAQQPSLIPSTTSTEPGEEVDYRDAVDPEYKRLFDLMSRSKDYEVITMTPTKQQMNANNPPGEMDSETEERIKKGEIVVTDKTEAGRRINDMFKKWELML